MAVQAAEEQAALGCFAAVEAEGELVEVGVKAMLATTCV